MPPIRIALVGLGKISIDEHIPAISRDARFVLAGAASPRPCCADVRVFNDLSALLANVDIDAVAVNTPPQVRFDIARTALLAGKHVMLEKPPGLTAGEVRMLAQIAERQGVTLFAAWHSRHAAGVEPARVWLSDREVTRVRLRWCEDVRQWHPGQTWIWETGGLGVFDPGINALSILTSILPEPLLLDRADFDVPGNRQMPTAARLTGKVGLNGAFDAVLDFQQTGPPCWQIDVTTASGSLLLEHGGAKLTLDGVAQTARDIQEYAAVYDRFASLISDGAIDIDLRPLELTAEAFLLASRRYVADFDS